MTVSASLIRDIAREARGPLERRLDDAELLAAIGRKFREEGGDWPQLKALVNAQLRDERDESGEGKHVEKIIDRADNAAAYSGLLGKMNNFSNSDDVPAAKNPTLASTATEKPVQQFSSPPADDLGIPAFLDRTGEEASI